MTASGGNPGAGQGTVTFFDNLVAIPSCTNVPLTTNTADCTISTLAGGAHSITARYNGFTSAGPNGQTWDTSNSNTVSHSVNANAAAPSVDAGGPYSGSEGSAISLDGTVNDADGDPLTYLWMINYNGNIDAGGSCTFGDATGVDTTLTCNDDSNGGAFTVTLTASGDPAGPVADTASVTVANANPTGNLTNNGPIDEGSSATASFTGVSDPSTADAASLHFVFSCTGADLSTKTYADGTATNSVSCPFDDGPSNHTITGRTIDKDEGAFSDDTSVTVNNVDPETDAGVAGAAINEGSTWTGSGSFTDPGADTWTATVNYGDGSGVQALALVGKTFSLSHLYADDDADDTYTVTVCVTDDDLGVDCDTVDVTVNNVDPETDAGVAGAAINEGSTWTGSGSFTDPGADTWTATVNYGDGSGVQALALVGKTFSLSHLYADDDADDTYTVTVCVTDDDLGVDCDTVDVTVNNVDPETDAGVAGAAINEGSTWTGSGSFTDPGADTWTATVNYGDGSGVQALALVGKTFSLSHLYADDDADDTYTVTVCVTDDDLGVDCDTVDVTVNNVDPETDAGVAGAAINEGSTWTGSGSFTDPGADTWTATVNYGDGSGVQALALVGKTFSLSHLYADDDADDTYTVTVCVTDDDLGVDCDTVDVTVNNVKPDTTLGTISGTGGTACLSGNSITLNFSSTDPAGANDVYSYSVNWGDGSPNTTGSGGASPAGGLSHTYGAGGPFVIVVTVNDDDPGVGVPTTAPSFSFLYISTGIQQPINGTGTRSSFKIGSTIPVKLNFVDCSGNLVSGLTLTVGLMKLDSNADPANETVPASVPDVGQTMRANGPGGYIYNLSTKRSQLCSGLAPCTSGGDLTAGSYRLTITGALINPVVAYFDAKQ